MKIIGKIEFEDGTEVSFTIDSDGTANWTRYQCQPPHSHATTDLLDDMAAALVEHADEAERLVSDAR